MDMPGVYKMLMVRMLANKNSLLTKFRMKGSRGIGIRNGVAANAALVG